MTHGTTTSGRTHEWQLLSGGNRQQRLANLAGVVPDRVVDQQVGTRCLVPGQCLREEGTQVLLLHTRIDLDHGMDAAAEILVRHPDDRAGPDAWVPLERGFDLGREDV